MTTFGKVLTISLTSSLTVPLRSESRIPLAPSTHLRTVIPFRPTWKTEKAHLEGKAGCSVLAGVAGNDVTWGPDAGSWKFLQKNNSKIVEGTK